MNCHRRRHRREGQVLPIAAIGIAVMLVMCALVIDGGNAFAQERGTQNAADSASLAGSATILANYAGAGRTGADVDAAVRNAFTSNGSNYVSADYIQFDGTS